MKFDELFPLKVFINLDKRTDRLKECLEIEFPKVGIEQIIRIPGQVFTGTNNSWINGAIGCLSSHVLALRYALENNSSITIYEDDVKFSDHSREIMDFACEELTLLNYKMIYWGANILKPFYQISDHLAKLTHAQSTVSYSVNINFVEELLSYIPLDRFDMPIDMIYADKVIPNNDCYISIPMICSQRKDKSDIENAIVDYESYLWKRYDEALVRLPLTK